MSGPVRHLPPPALPVWTPVGALVHVGTLNPGDKGTDSYEGHGLSVSERPEAWEHIASLGGNPWWALDWRNEAEEPMFLDWHATSPEQRHQWLHWGRKAGLCEALGGYRLTWRDVETQERQSTLIADLASARGEFDEHKAQGAEPTLEPATLHRLTRPALRRLRRSFADPIETPELVALLWVEQETFLQGMYWDDELDPVALSAPRAVILPERLAQWKTRLLRHEDRELGLEYASRPMNLPSRDEPEGQALRFIERQSA